MISLLVNKARTGLTLGMTNTTEIILKTKRGLTFITKMGITFKHRGV